MSEEFTEVFDETKLETQTAETPPEELTLEEKIKQLELELKEISTPPEITRVKGANGETLTAYITLQTIDPAEVEKAKQPKPKYNIKSYYQNDMGNARRFLDQYEDVVRYCAEEKQWYHFNGKKWAAETETYMEKLVWDALDTSYQRDREVLETFNENDAMKDLLKHFLGQRKRSGNMSTIRNCLAAAATQVLIKPEELDCELYWFHAKNGSCNVKDMQVRSYHEKTQFSTKCANASLPLDIMTTDFESLNDFCPNWMRFVLQCCMGDVQLMRYLQRAAGYSILCGDVAEQSVFCLLGEGRNGKSLFINTLAEVAGDYATKIDSSLLCRNRFGERDNETLKEIHRIRGCRFVYANEFSRSNQLNESLIKNITDGGKINGRPIYDKSIVYKPTYKLWFSTNHMPNLNELDEGIRRRLIIIPFNLRLAPEEVDKTLPEKFEKEANGILYWLFSGCFGYFQTGLEQPEAVRKATASYFEQQDLFQLFVSDNYVIDPDGKTGAQALYQHYRRWCEENGEKPTNNNTFGAEMIRLKIEKKHCSDGNFYSLSRIE